MIHSLSVSGQLRPTPGPPDRPCTIFLRHGIGRFDSSQFSTAVMAKSLGKILVMDDNEDVLLAARIFLKQHAALVHTEKDPEPSSGAA